MSFPDRVEREKCWTSRDVLWKCLDENGDKHQICAEFRKLYESSCPSQWVKHFDRKREYLKFKDRIQSEGSCTPFLVGVKSEELVRLGVAAGKEVPKTVTKVDEEAGASQSRIIRKFQPPTYT